MTAIMHSDIFFFITAISVIVVSLCLTIVLVYVVIILKDVRVVIKKIRDASSDLEHDFQSLRSTIKNESSRLQSLFEFAFKYLFRLVGMRSKKKSNGKADSDKAQKVETD